VTEDRRLQQELEEARIQKLLEEEMRLDCSLTYQPRRVVSIISGSRSGSTILKHALCLHPDLSSLAGEEEPYYKLARNGYPWHHSDEFYVANNPDLIRALIANELHNHESAHNRHLLQEYRVEEPPYVEEVTCRMTDTLVLKTPQNCYRRGVIEQLYPEAEVIYLLVERDPRAVVNGLIDGWESADFTARLTPQGWWKFDMPPGWSWEEDLVSRCLRQWRTSQQYLEREYRADVTASVRFEDFEREWRGVCYGLWGLLLGLPSYHPPNTELPHLSSTLPPEPGRWRRKRPWLDYLDWWEVLEL
jgi:hypothetical protein